MRQPAKRAIVPTAAACAVFVMWAGASAARAADDPGKQVYLRYCSACHGSEGKGDGVVSQLMRPPATDLTQLAKQNGGEFPALKVMKVIDGRETPRAHGDPDMPVWGELLKSEVGDPMNADVRTKGVVMQITDFLRTIQAK